MDKNNFLICSLPRMSLTYPPAAPAILKSILKRAKYTCSTVDLVVEWYKHFKDHDSWTTIDSWSAVGSLTLEKSIEQDIESFADKWAKKLCDRQAEWIGLSIFSYESHKIGQLLSAKIKEHNPKQKIFMGGSGITNVTEPYAEKLFEAGIIDAYITGEGEQSILELAKGNLDYPGINNKNYQQVPKKVIDESPTPDFDDYDLDLYGKEDLGTLGAYHAKNWADFNKNIHTIPITASRGCVRSCAYCDVPVLWPKFTHRGGESVADEIIGHNKKSGTRKFHFTDSLVNGSMKEFRIMIDKLAKYNHDNNANITWTGQAIFRPKGQHTAEDWQMIARSGGSVLEIGIESGCEDVRFAMGKKFTNEDVMYELEHVRKNKIATWLNFIIGWPTETDSDFEKCKQFLIDLHPYAVDKTILHLDLGATVRIQPNTPLWLDREKMGIEMIPTGGEQEDLLWWCKNNPTLTFSKRILRRLQYGKLAQELMFTVPEGEMNVRYLWEKWNQLKQKEKQFHEKRRNQNIV